MTDTLPPAVILTGPTAAGKTAVALALARRFPVALISADSAQVYRGLDVGSAKPDADTLANFPHALVDIRDPEDPYSAADFAADAVAAMQRATAAGRIPVVVGGTMLYLRALRYGLDPLPAADAATRARIEAEAARLGWPALHARLAAIDPVTAARIRPGDPQRIQRALEIHALTGRPPGELMHGRRADRLAGSLALVLTPADRHILHRNIARRWRQMMAAGVIGETARLLARPGISRELPALRAVGYRQVAAFLDGDGDLDECGRRVRAASRQLAKRQLTAMRQWPGALWYDPEGTATIGRIFRRMENFRTNVGS